MEEEDGEGEEEDEFVREDNNGDTPTMLRRKISGAGSGVGAGTPNTGRR